MEAPETVRATLRRQRLGLLVRERDNLLRAKRLLAELEGSASRGNGAQGVLEQARRSVRLAEDARDLGIRDAHRLDLSVEQLSEAAGLSEPDILVILDDS